MNIFFQQFVNGLTLGSVYALVALGLTLVYGILHVPNFAHGAFYMVGAYLSFTGMTKLGLNYWLAMGGAAMVVAVIAVLSDKLVYHPLRNSPGTHHMIAAIGLLLFLESGVQVIWGAEFRRLPMPYPQIFRSFDLTLPAQRLIIIAAAFSLMGLLHLFLRKTLVGSTILAMAQNREGAALVGIDAGRVSTLTFAISGVLATVAAALFAPIALIYPAMGHLVIMKAFVIIVLGGMGSVPGAITGAMILGFAESFAAFYISTDYKDVVSFAILVLILSVRPQGLFSHGVR